MPAPKNPEAYALWKERMSLSRKGKKCSEAHRTHISEGLLGHKVSIEARIKIGDKNRGGHGNKGWKPTEENKKNMSKSKKNLIASGAWHPPNNKKGRSFEEQYGKEKASAIKNLLSASIRAAIAKKPGKIMHPWPESLRKQLSNSCLENISQGKTNPQKHRFKAKSSVEITVKGGNIFCQSNWERTFTRFLDKRKDVLLFEKDKIRLQYILNNEVRIYIVDFLVTYTNGDRKLVEIKPFNLLETTENVAKFAAAIKWAEENNSTFVVVTEKELSMLEGIKL
jgi:hypothetical protein